MKTNYLSNQLILAIYYIYYPIKMQFIMGKIIYVLLDVNFVIKLELTLLSN